MGLKVMTDAKPVTIIRQDKTSSGGKPYTQYSIMVSSKNSENAWISGFIECGFKKGVSVNNKSKININNAFYTVSDFNGKKYTKLMITDFAVVEDGEKPVQPTSGDGFMDVPTGISDELPFQ